MEKINNSPMLNAYPDSMGGSLADIIRFLNKPGVMSAFGSLYILPSIFNTDLDRGFSVIDYGINELMGSTEDLNALKELGISLKLDFILNHASVLSPQFQDLLNKGECSEYKDFFIDWNRFWEGSGVMTAEGYIRPDPELIKDMFFRKPGLPILMVRFPDGRKVPYWNTFYQEVRYSKLDSLDLIKAIDIQYASAVLLADIVNSGIESGKKPEEIDFGRFERYRSGVIELLESGRKYLGQMDLNIKSPRVWAYYDMVLHKLAEYGADIVRLDAFAYAAKTAGKKNFLNEPDTWELLKRIKAIADKYNLILLPEIHAGYGEGIYKKIAGQGFLTYDFFLPGLIIDAFENVSGEYLVKWALEQKEHNIHTVNMLGCHDGIPLLDLRGLLEEDRIQSLIDTVVSRGGYVKDLHGEKNIYYQVNAAYYSALGEDGRRLLLARAIQLFMPGKPQVWYLDLFAGRNDYEAVKKAGAGGHKEINRTNLTPGQVEEALEKSVVKDQLKLLCFRNAFPAFGFDAELFIAEGSPQTLDFRWKKDGYTAVLTADLKALTFTVSGIDPSGDVIFEYKQE
jgi:sucrose phosphorylase